MNTRLTAMVVVAVATLALAGSAFAAKTYQVTGSVLEFNDKTITVQKGDDKWELDRDGATKVKGGDLKLGDKVTIHYVMTARTIELKGEKATDKELKASEAKKEKPAKKN